MLLVLIVRFRVISLFTIAHNCFSRQPETLADGLLLLRGHSLDVMFLETVGYAHETVLFVKCEKLQASGFRRGRIGSY